MVIVATPEDEEGNGNDMAKGQTGQLFTTMNHQIMFQWS